MVRLEGALKRKMAQLTPTSPNDEGAIYRGVNGPELTGAEPQTSQWCRGSSGPEPRHLSVKIKPQIILLNLSDVPKMRADNAVYTN